MTNLSHVVKTYRMLRLIAGLTILLIPLAIVGLGYAVETKVMPTLSHYYYLENRPGLVRTLFTGFLIFSGGILIAYRGFDNRDNVTYWIAGLAAICVALFPKICDKGGEANCGPGLLSWLHMPFAVLLFLFAAYAVWYCGGRKLSSQLSNTENAILNKWKWIGLSLMALGISFYVLQFGMGGSKEDFRIAGLVIELFGFVGFSAHWLSMSFVISEANDRIAATNRSLSVEDNTTQQSTPSSANQTAESVERKLLPTIP